MPLSPAVVSDLRAAATSLGVRNLPESLLTQLQPLVNDMFGAFGFVDQEVDPLVQAPSDARHHHFPSAVEDRFGAWSVRTSIRTRDNGPLAGRRVAIKDSVMVSGVPMRNGSSELRGFVPSMDATVVTRLLEAGAEIVGKTNCEYFCVSGGSHTSALGPVRNPHRPTHTSGGSSSGSAVVLATGQVELAVGADQAGSIRIPASFTGVVGLKPTYGLVPYTGIAPIEPVIDHVGPMTATVADNALMLEVIAGPDGLDRRQPSGLSAANYSEQMSRGAVGLRIGIVREGFSQPGSEPDVNEKVRAAAARLESLGATVVDISIPQHLSASAIWVVAAVQGLTHTLGAGCGFGIGRMDAYPTDLMAHLFERRAEVDSLPPHILLMMLTAETIRMQRGWSLYGKAVNLARRLRMHYDAALSNVDLLLMPTTPMKAPPLPPADAPVALSWQRAAEMLGNTCPFDITHHPAISIPCGMSDGLPVGVMLVGRHFEEGTIYRAARAFELSADWRTL